MGTLKGLVGSMLKVGTIGFGGGSALIPVVEKEVVHRRGYLDERTFTSHTVIANITPGALPVKLGALAGAHTGSVAASVLAALAVALPGAFATVALIAVFSLVGPTAIRFVEFAAVGIVAFIIVLLVHYITTVIIRARNRVVAVAITVAAFLATGANQLVALVGVLVGRQWQPELPRLSAVGLVLVSLGAIAALSLFSRPTDGGGASLPMAGGKGKNMASAVAFSVLAVVALAVGFALGSGQFMSLVGLSTVSSFGGGEAYVGVADGFFVAPGHVDSLEFYGQVVPVANALPGPILVKVASALGYSFGLANGGPGLAVAVAGLAFVLSVALCSALAVLVMAGYGKASKSAFVRNLSVHILPVICGLLVTTSLSMVLANVDIGLAAGASPVVVAWATVAGVVLLWWLQRRYQLHDLVLLALGGGVSLVVLTLLT